MGLWRTVERSFQNFIPHLPGSFSEVHHPNEVKVNEEIMHNAWPLVHPHFGGCPPRG